MNLISESVRSVMNRLAPDEKLHCIRTSVYARALAEFVTELWSSFPETQHEEVLHAIHDGAYFHDMGKIMYSQDLLRQPYALTETERTVICNHTLRAAEILEADEDFQNEDELYRRVVTDCCLYHHERFDGKGYPFGLHGNKIPLTAHIVALCDVFDALSSKRSYKRAMSFEETYSVMEKGCGSQFSPEVFKHFESNKQRFQELLRETGRQHEIFRAGTHIGL